MILFYSLNRLFHKESTFAVENMYILVGVTPNIRFGFILKLISVRMS